MRIIDAHIHYSDILSFKECAKRTSLLDYSPNGYAKEAAENGIVHAVCMGLTIKAGVPDLVGFLVCIIVGALCGIVNGLLISRGKLPPFIATLGMMSMARGLAVSVSDGRSITQFSDFFRWIGTASFPGTVLQVQVVLLLILCFIAFYILKYRKFGRYVYAIGGNEEVARLTGIGVKNVKVGAYMISGITCGIAAIVLSAKLNAAQPIAGNGYELDAIAAVVIGGASLSGGVGSIWGSLVGAIMMGVIRNGLTLLGVSSYLQQFIIGAVIVFAVLLEQYSKDDHR